PGLARAPVRSPERDEPPAGGSDGASGDLPGVGVDAGTPDRQRCRQAIEFELETGNPHGVNLRASAPPACTSRRGRAEHRVPASGRARDGRTPAAAPASAPAA